MITKHLSKKKICNTNKNNISFKNKEKNQPKYNKNKKKKKGGYKEPSEIKLTKAQLESNEIRNLWKDINLPNVNKLNHIFPYTYPFPLKNIDEIKESKVKDYKWKQNESIPNLLSNDQYFFTNPDFNKNMVFDTIREKKKIIEPLKQFTQITPLKKFCLKYKCDEGTEVDKCYRKKARELHPDKGKDPEIFKDFGTLFEEIENKKEKCPTKTKNN